MTIDPIEVSVVIDATPRAAFSAFVRDIGQWWPLATHSVSGARSGRPAQLLVIEPRLGGKIIEHDADGTQHIWGRVSRWDEPFLVAFDWHVGREPDMATRVMVRFDPTDDGRTGITLVHANWEVLADAGVAIRARNAGANGWPGLIGTHFANHLRGLKDGATAANINP